MTWVLTRLPPRFTEKKRFFFLIRLVWLTTCGHSADHLNVGELSLHIMADNLCLSPRHILNKTITWNQPIWTKAIIFNNAERKLIACLSDVAKFSQKFRRGRCLLAELEKKTKATVRELEMSRALKTLFLGNKNHNTPRPRCERFCS